MTHAVVGVALGAVVPFARRPPLFWALSMGLSMLDFFSAHGLEVLASELVWIGLPALIVTGGTIGRRARGRLHQPGGR